MSLNQHCQRVLLEPRHNLAVAVPVEVSPFSGRLARVVDSAAAREHEAERACLEASRNTGKPRALVFVSPDVGDDGLIKASEGIVSGVLAACLRERGVAALRELPRLVPCHCISFLWRVDRHGDGLSPQTLCGGRTIRRRTPMQHRRTPAHSRP